MREQDNRDIETMCTSQHQDTPALQLFTVYRRGSRIFFSTGGTKNVANQGHSSIELEMYKEYIAELRAKRA